MLHKVLLKIIAWVVYYAKFRARGPCALGQKKTTALAVVCVATHVGVEPAFEVIGLVLALIVGLLQVAVACEGVVLVPLVVVSAVVALANLEEGHGGVINLDVEVVKFHNLATASGANYLSSFQHFNQFLSFCCTYCITTFGFCQELNVKKIKLLFADFKIGFLVYNKPLLSVFKMTEFASFHGFVILFFQFFNVSALNGFSLITGIAT